jgi:very-short-patch-repair endonuclease
MTISQSPVQEKGLHIPIAEFSVCLLDGLTRSEIAKRYKGHQYGRRYLQKFAYHLKHVHGISIKEYVIRYGKIEWPKCVGKEGDAGYDVTRAWGLLFRTNLCDTGRTKKRVPWCKGVTKENSPVMAEIAAKRRGEVKSPETRRRMREGYARAKEAGMRRRRNPHKESTKELIRLSTAQHWAQGCFSRDTSIQRKMQGFLNTLTLCETPRKEYQEVYYSIDYAFPQHKVAIECDGDYYHINPRFYPNGPKDAIQQRNAGRDKAKNTFLQNRGWTVIRIWECEINAGSFKEPLICKLRELGLLSH